MTKKTKPALKWAVALILAFILLPFIFGKRENATLKRLLNFGFFSDHEQIAHQICKDFIKSDHRGDIVKFPDEDYKIWKREDGTYEIKSYFVTKGYNPGSSIRNYWMCKARFMGGDARDQINWEMISFESLERVDL